MVTLQGRCSTFGGADDEGMKPRPGMPEGDTGLALYEPKEANKRPDLFYSAPDDEPNQVTWKRLKTRAFYCALRFDHSLPRHILQNTIVKITNPKNGESVEAYCVDWGPSGDLDRVVDMSPGCEEALGTQTNDVVDVEWDVASVEP